MKEPILSHSWRPSWRRWTSRGPQISNFPTCQRWAYYAALSYSDHGGPALEHGSHNGGRQLAFVCWQHTLGTHNTGQWTPTECSLQDKGRPLTSNEDPTSDIVSSLIRECFRPMNPVSHSNQSPRAPSLSYRPSKTAVMYNTCIFRPCKLQTPISRPQMTALRCYKLQMTHKRIKRA